MLKKSVSGVLAARKGPTYREQRYSDVEITGGAFPFAKIHSKGERPTRIAVRTTSPLHSLRPCLGKGASKGEESVPADSGRAGEITARVGRMRSLAFLCILRAISLVPAYRPSKLCCAEMIFQQPASGPCCRDAHSFWRWPLILQWVHSSGSAPTIAPALKGASLFAFDSRAPGLFRSSPRQNTWTPDERNRAR